MALYNNGFPATYQQYYPVMPQQNYPQMQQPQQPTPQPQQSQSSIIWVQGEAGAKSYLVAPNTTVQLWDSEKQTIYLKSADASGMPSMKTLDYTIRDAQPTPAPVTTGQQPVYATKEDVQALYAQISGIRAEIDSMTQKKPVAKPKKEAADDE